MAVRLELMTWYANHPAEISISWHLIMRCKLLEKVHMVIIWWLYGDYIVIMVYMIKDYKGIWNVYRCIDYSCMIEFREINWATLNTWLVVSWHSFWALFVDLVQANVEAAGEGGESHETLQESLDLQKLQVSKPKVGALTDWNSHSGLNLYEPWKRRDETEQYHVSNIFHPKFEDPSTFAQVCIQGRTANGLGVPQDVSDVSMCWRTLSSLQGPFCRQTSVAKAWWKLKTIVGASPDDPSAYTCAAVEDDATRWGRYGKKWDGTDWKQIFRSYDNLWSCWMTQAHSCFWRQLFMACGWYGALGRVANFEMCHLRSLGRVWKWGLRKWGYRIWFFWVFNMLHMLSDDHQGGWGGCINVLDEHFLYVTEDAHVAHAVVWSSGGVGGVY